MSPGGRPGGGRGRWGHAAPRALVVQCQRLRWRWRGCGYRLEQVRFPSPPAVPRAPESAQASLPTPTTPPRGGRPRTCPLAAKTAFPSRPPCLLRQRGSPPVRVAPRGKVVGTYRSIQLFDTFYRTRHQSSDNQTACRYGSFSSQFYFARRSIGAQRPPNVCGPLASTSQQFRQEPGYISRS